MRVAERPGPTGIRENRGQFALLLAVVALVGATIGQERSLLPILARREFGVASATAATAFLVTFGLSKAAANLAAGGLSDRYGRRRVLLAGWIAAAPLPFALAFAPAWGWIVAANVLLGVNQGFAWSGALVMKVDLAGPRRRGLATGLNEFAGYVAAAAAAYGTAALAAALGTIRPWPFLPGAAVVALGVVLTLASRETRDLAVGDAGPGDRASLRAALRWSAGGHRALTACSQAGLVTNAKDAAMVGLFPLLATSAGEGLERVGAVAGAYAATWGVAQLLAGHVSDGIGRKPLVVAGLGVQAAGLAGFAALTGTAAWLAAAAVVGLGTALVYPTLIAAVGDAAPGFRRASAIGAYRFWRDVGYAAGALGAGLLADAVGIRPAFAAVAALAAVSAVVFLAGYRAAPRG